MIKKYYFFLFALILVLSSCKSDKSGKNASQPEANSIQKPVPEQAGPDIPGVPKDILITLLNKCNSIDYIFHDLPVSMNQTEDADINQNIGFIDFNRPVGQLKSGCKPIARKFFQVPGQNSYDADVYFSENCQYYVFVDKSNKALYANYMTNVGVEFYKNILNQVSGAMPKK
jgi:hypothetical protein